MKSISAGTVTVGVIAIVLGLLAAYVVRRSLDAPEKPAARADNTVPMVVAKSNIPRHARITTAQLEVKRVAADKLPEGAVKLPALLEGRVAREAIEAGEMISEEKVLDVGERPGLTHKLEPGFRALPIVISGQNMAATLLHAGSSVDIHLTFEDSRPEVGGVATRTILQNVKVIAKGQPSGRTNSRDVNANFVTVAVTNEQANKLITAQQAGTLSITLCGDKEEGLGPHEPTGNTLVAKADLMGIKIAPSYTVQRWTGNKMEVVTLTPDLVLESREATAADNARTKGHSIPASIEGNPDHLAGGK